MKYKYYRNEILLFESDSKIKFNEKLFPSFAEIEPVVTEPKKKVKFYDNEEEK